MSFLRHQEIFPSDEGASFAANALAHRSVVRTRDIGLWCKLKPTGGSVVLAWLSELRWAQAASAASHNSDIVAFRPPSLPVLNCPFLIFSANSIPEIVTAALSNRLNLSMGRIRCFTLRWSCSTRLFKYWLERTFTRRGCSDSPPEAEVQAEEETAEVECGSGNPQTNKAHPGAGERDVRKTFGGRVGQRADQ
jgi:hypothetical protein